MHRRVAGNPDSPKASQAYPLAFCREVQSLWARSEDLDEDMNKEAAFPPDHLDEDSDEEAAWDEWRQAAAKCNWHEAHPERLAMFLNVPTTVPL